METPTPSTPAGTTAAAAGATLAGATSPGSPPTPGLAVGAGNGKLPSVEEIFAKRAAGIKLTKAEAGRLSQVGRSARRPAQPAGARAPSGRPAEPLGLEDSGSAPGLDAPPVDPDLCKATAGEILDTLNEAGQSSIKAKAAKAGADGSTAKEYLELAALKPGARTTMVNTSPSWLPKLLRVAGLDPQNAPEAMAGVAALLWGLGFYRASANLDRKAKEREAAPADVKGADGSPTP